MYRQYSFGITHRKLLNTRPCGHFPQFQETVTLLYEMWCHTKCWNCDTVPIILYSVHISFSICAYYLQVVCILWHLFSLPSAPPKKEKQWKSFMSFRCALCFSTSAGCSYTSGRSWIHSEKGPKGLWMCSFVSAALPTFLGSEASNL